MNSLNGVRVRFFFNAVNCDINRKVLQNIPKIRTQGVKTCPVNQSSIWQTILLIWYNVYSFALNLKYFWGYYFSGSKKSKLYCHIIAWSIMKTWMKLWNEDENKLLTKSLYSIHQASIFFYVTPGSPHSLSRMIVHFHVLEQFMYNSSRTH